MFYYLFHYLDKNFHFPGAGVFQYISFRASAAAIFSLFITVFLGKYMIAWLCNKQIKEEVRDLGLNGQRAKKNIPTMGGLIIILGIIVPTLCFAKLANIYIILLLVTVVWMGTIGFIDDYIKVFKKNKKGLAGKFKIIGQIGLGLIVGLTLYFHEEVVLRAFEMPEEILNNTLATFDHFTDAKDMKTTIPFFKNNELHYDSLFPFVNSKYTWAVYVFIVIFIITAVSNGANMTDGIDGLAAGTSSIIGIALAILAYVSGNIIFSQYLNIMYIPESGELVIFCTAFVGACIGFLWYNAYPAQIFMGDTGSLTLGGIIAVIAIIIRKELLIPILCGIFFIENFSVVLQVMYFKYSKKKYGIGKRILRMAPLHHHYQKLSLHESKIVTRFLILGVLLAIITLLTLKIR